MTENISAVWPDQPEMIHHMTYLEDMASRCSVIIEIGCGHGNGSTRAFERGLLRTTHPAGARLFVSVDNNVDKPDVKPAILCWHKVTGDSRDTDTFETVCRLLPLDEDNDLTTVDLFYIDTDHVYDQLWKELINWVDLASCETIWLFHDVHMSGTYNKMTDAIKDFCASQPCYTKWEYKLLTEESHGLGMMKWKK